VSRDRIAAFHAIASQLTERLTEGITERAQLSADAPPVRQ